MNYYEGTIADNICNLLAYPTNEEMHLIIHQAHEQAIAFAKILEFVRYEDLFYGGTFKIHENNLVLGELIDVNDPEFCHALKVDVSVVISPNQNNDRLKEIEKANFELNEISKAAELVSMYDISNLEKTDDLKQSQTEIELIYQSNKQITQKKNETAFQTGVLSLKKLDVLFLVSQRRKHKAYSSQRMERIQVTPRYKTSNLALNFNFNKINSIIASDQDCNTKSEILRIKRWQKRSRLESLERHPNVPGNNRKLIIIYEFIL